MVVFTQLLLNEVALNIFNNLIPHLTTGTGDDPIDLTTADLETPVQIGVSDRNKGSESSESSVTDNFFVQKYKLTATEPNSLPVNLQELGIQDGLNESTKLKAGFVLNAASTKDNTSQWVIRFSGRVVEGSASDACNG